jgi:hypothetical protein
MTKPLRNQSKLPDHPKGEPFDPEDLARRLAALLSQQELDRTERRNKKTTSSYISPFGATYVPQSAAQSFALTTTQGAMNPGSVHKLAQAALRKNHTTDSSSIPNLSRSIALDHARAEKEKLLSRNQFQWSHGFAEAAALDKERNVYKPPQRTLGFSAAQSQRRSLTSVRPKSTGNLDSEIDTFARNSKANTSNTVKPNAAQLSNDRHDWAQRDDSSEKRKRRSSLFVTALTSRNKKQQVVDESAALANSQTFPVEPIKRRKSSIFSLLKRREH